MATWPTRFTRPAFIIFSTNNLIGSTDYSNSADLVTTDHGRSDVSIKPERIETAGRMVNGTYRSHFVAEKKSISWSWSDIPSRAVSASGREFTADGFAAGNDIIEYLESKKGAFYIKLVYDANTSTAPLGSPEKVYRVMVKDYSYAVKMRAPGFDTMDIDVNLVEV